MVGSVGKKGVPRELQSFSQVCMPQVRKAISGLKSLKLKNTISDQFAAAMQITLTFKLWLVVPDVSMVTLSNGKISEQYH